MTSAPKLALLLIVSFHFNSRTFQNVQVDLERSSYELDPEFGNVSTFETNQTHTGPIIFWFKRSISSFTYRMAFKTENNSVAAQTISPCDRNSAKSMERLIGMFDVAQIDAYIPFYWRCPIPQGKTIANSRPRQINFPLMVPSFLAKPGSYVFTEVFKVKENKKLTTFLTGTKFIKVKVT